jgi:hypothetical protein
MILYLLCPLCSWSYSFENREYTDYLGFSFSFKGNIFSYVKYGYEQYGIIDATSIPKTISGPYIVKFISGYTVVEVDFEEEGKRDIFVFYESSHIILYDTKLKETFYGTENVRSEAMLFPVQVSASSYFTEILGGKEVKYLPENLASRDITRPWVEGAEGPGIGEFLRTRRSNIDNSEGHRHFLIINGFFSPSQPSLYYDNCRIKKLLMRGFDQQGRLRYEGVKELADTPNLQYISSVISLAVIEFEILEVYPGNRFEDTAISGLFHDGLRFLSDIEDSLIRNR